MYVDIIVPEVGDGVTQATISEWLISVGDHVVEGETIVEIMTDKAAFEVPSPAYGILKEIVIESDTEVAVGSVIGRIEILKKSQD